MSILKANRIENLTTTAGGINVNNQGRVGIGGVTSPFDMLHVKAATDCNYNFSSAGGTEASLEIFNDAGTSNTPLNIRASVYKFKVQSTEKCRITSDGLTFNGDTAAINALSDYEEGTWTPRVYSNDLTFDSATYVKVGKMVTVHCNLTGVGSYTASTGNPFYIFDFPFTTASGGTTNTATSATGSCKLTNMNSSITTGTLSVCMDKGNTRCRIQKNATNAADSFISLQEVGTGSFSIVINVTYYTT